MTPVSESEQNAAVVRRFFAVAWGEKDADAATLLFTDDYRLHDPGNPWLTPGPAGIRQMVTAYNAAFPDSRFAIEAQIAEGEHVATRWRVRSTHRGELRGLEASGRPSTTSGILVSRLRDGLIAEEWTQWNRHGLLQQIDGDGEETAGVA